MAEILSPVLILGAGSDVGKALAHAYAKENVSLILAARDPQALEADATDLRLRYKVSVAVSAFDAADPKPSAFYDGLGNVSGTVVSVVGLLGDQAISEVDHDAATRVIEANYLGLVRVLHEAATRMERAGRGCIIGVSSVAGERGRASNYVYGSAKAGYTAFLSGLRNRLSKKNIAVITVIPGFINTRMTAGMKLPPRLTSQPDQVAAAIVAAQRKGRDVIFVSPIWRLIMAVICTIPERIFKKLSL